MYDFFIRNDLRKEAVTSRNVVPTRRLDVIEKTHAASTGNREVLRKQEQCDQSPGPGQLRQDISELPQQELARFRREKLGFVFQDFNLLDTLTLEENIGLALTINHMDPNLVRDRVQDVAMRLGIDDILEKFPTQVSGGQKQRAACARAMVAGQSLILADEPTGALDSRASKNLLEIMAKMNREMRATILMVTHDAYSASYASRVLFLKDGRVFNELLRGKRARAVVYHEILDVLGLLGGDIRDVM